MVSPEQIARVCHEANAAFCRTIGGYSQSEWAYAPEWQRQSAIAGVGFHLGHHAARRSAPPPSASHDSWLKQKAAEGWTYGPVEDPEKKEHPCMVTFDQLPPEQQLKDFLFSAVVNAFIEAELI